MVEWWWYQSEPYSGSLQRPRTGNATDRCYAAGSCTGTYNQNHNPLVSGSFPPMILDEKVIMRPLLIPPPAYHSQSSPSLHTVSSNSPSFSKFNLSTLPPHILLQILYRTFPQSSRIADQDTPELQRKTLY